MEEIKKLEDEIDKSGLNVMMKRQSTLREKSNIFGKK